MKKFICSLVLLWASFAVATPTQVMDGVDDGTYHVQLGHSFPYYGGVFTDAWMSTNGFILLYDPINYYGNPYTTNDGCCHGFNPNNPPSYWESVNNVYQRFSYMIAPLWTDLIDSNQFEGDGFYYETDEGGTLFTWQNICELSSNDCWSNGDITKSNTFSLQLWPGGSFDFLYEQVSIRSNQTWIGFSGDASDSDEVTQLFYTGNFYSTDSDTDRVSMSDIAGFASTQLNDGTYAWWGDDAGYSSAPAIDCSNPLNDTSCEGYDAAYLDQQCGIDALYDTECDGYQQAYDDQQCGFDPLYSQQCDGYQQAYDDQQCALDPLYGTQCDGYQQAYDDQQCGLDALYSNECDGYAQAWLDEECKKDSQFSASCPGYKIETEDTYTELTSFDPYKEENKSFSGSDDGSMQNDPYGDGGSDPYGGGGPDPYSDGSGYTESYGDDMTYSDTGYQEPKMDEPPPEPVKMEEEFAPEGPVYEEEPTYDSTPAMMEQTEPTMVRNEEPSLFEKVASEEIKEEEVFEEPIFAIEEKEPLEEPTIEERIERSEPPPPEVVEEPEVELEVERLEDPVREVVREEALAEVSVEREAEPEKKMSKEDKIKIALDIAENAVSATGTLVQPTSTVSNLGAPVSQEEQAALEVAYSDSTDFSGGGQEMSQGDMGSGDQGGPSQQQEVQVVETVQIVQTQQDTQQEQQVEEDFGDTSSTQTIDQTFGEQMTQSFATGGNIGTFLSGQQPDFSKFDVKPPSVDVQVDVAKVENAVQDMTATEVAQSAANLAEQIQSGGGFDEDQSLAVTVIGYNPEIQAYNNVVLPDRDEFYKSDVVYKGNENKDNMGLMYRMMGRGDRLHSEMVQQQYEER